VGIAADESNITKLGFSVDGAGFDVAVTPPASHVTLDRQLLVSGLALYPVLCENSAGPHRSTNRRIRRDRRTLVSRNSIQREGVRCRIWRELHRASFSGRLAP
jgi:hypothetical protein